MDDSRLHKLIYDWMCSKRSNRCKNWSFRLLKQLEKYNIQENTDNSVVELSNAIFNDYKIKWYQAINSERGASSTGLKKLRTYKLFKDTYNIEAYVKMVMPKCYRSALAKFRCGVAPIRVETGRYERLPFAKRMCPLCNDGIENELHVLTSCSMYNDLRDQIYTKAREHSENFDNLPDEQKMCFIMSNDYCVKVTAKTCWEILKRRRNLLYSN